MIDQSEARLDHLRNTREKFNKFEMQVLGSRDLGRNIGLAADLSISLLAAAAKQPLAGINPQAQLDLQIELTKLFASALKRSGIVP